MTNWNLAINKEGSPFLGVVVSYGDGKVTASAVLLGLDVGGRIYWGKNNWGLTAVVQGKEYLGGHLSRSKEKV